MEVVRSRSGAHIDVRAARGALLRVIHGSVYAKFFDGFRSGRGQCLANRQIGRRCALKRLRRGARKAGGAAKPVLFTTRADATELVLLPLKRLLASTPFSRNVLLVSRWPLAQMGWLPSPVLTPVPAGELRVHSGRKNGQAREAARRQRNRFDLVLFENVAVGGVNGVHQRRGFDGDRGADFADFKRRVHRCGAVALHGNRGNLLRSETRRG